MNDITSDIAYTSIYIKTATLNSELSHAVLRPRTPIRAIPRVVAKTTIVTLPA